MVLLFVILIDVKRFNVKVVFGELLLYVSIVSWEVVFRCIGGILLFCWFVGFSGIFWFGFVWIDNLSILIIVSVGLGYYKGNLELFCVSLIYIYCFIFRFVKDFDRIWLFDFFVIWFKFYFVKNV